MHQVSSVSRIFETAIRNLRAFPASIPRPSTLVVMWLLFYYLVVLPILSFSLVPLLADPRGILHELAQNPGYARTAIFETFRSLNEDAATVPGGRLVGFLIILSVEIPVGLALTSPALGILLLYFPEFHKRWHVLLAVALLITAHFQLHSFYFSELN